MEANGPTYFVPVTGTVIVVAPAQVNDVQESANSDGKVDEGDKGHILEYM